MSTEPKTYRAGTLVYTKATLAILFIWLLWGDFCFILMETVVPGIMPLKFQSLGAPNTLISSVMIVIPGFINAFCNPIISFRSDRFRSRWGRRIPFIMVTMPFLVLCLFGLAFGDKVGIWLQAHLGALIGHYSVTTVTLMFMGTAMTLFAFFNIFVNSVYWYLFNDVVPEHLLARYMSLFRMVSLAAGALYSMFLLEHAISHYTEILSGVGLLYLIGFGVMCFNVKEGQYPPPPEYVGGRTGVIPAIKTYFRECMFLPHYWYAFLASMGMCGIYVGFVFANLYNLSIGLTLKMTGEIAFAGSISAAIAILASGWLADRYHPIRLVLWGLVLQVLITPLGLIWLFWHPSPQIIFYVSLVLAVFLGGPIGVMISFMDPPLFMRIFPRERYGQFCSANSLCRSVAGIGGGALIGPYLDMLTQHWGSKIAYMLLPLWNMMAYLAMLFFVYKLYRSWKSYGGDEAYVAPIATAPAQTANPPLAVLPAGVSEPTP